LLLLIDVASAKAELEKTDTVPPAWTLENLKKLENLNIKEEPMKAPEDENSSRLFRPSSPETHFQQEKKTAIPYS
jgi:hypothetical protein